MREKVLKQYLALPLLYCCNHSNEKKKLPKTQQVKTIEMHSILVLKARSPKSRRWQGHILSKASKGESFLDSSNFWQFQRSLGQQLHHSISASVSTCLLFPVCLPCLSVSSLPLPFCMRCLPSSLDVGPTQIIQDDFILRSFIMSVKTLSLDMFQSTGSAGKDIDTYFREPPFNPPRLLTWSL